MKTINEVKDFWNNNPLFSGESEYTPGSKEFFEHHRQVYYEDVFASDFPEDLLIPKLYSGMKTLDLGCGVGFWVIEFLKRNKDLDFYAVDLTENALKITMKRLETYNLNAKLEIQNAEELTFNDDIFDHINCQGVIHHTPNTELCIKEIARVLKPGGTAYISVYYRNFFLRNWYLLKPLGYFLKIIGAKFKGRGRENIFTVNNVDEIVRLYDGDKNPIGKSYSRKDIEAMVSPYFLVDKVYLNFFPARSLPFKTPKFLHKILSRKMGFMIHLNLRKRLPNRVDGSAHN